MRVLTTFGIILSLAACAAGSSSAIASEALSRDQRQVILQQITRDCGLPSSTLLLIGEDELHIQPPPDASFESVDCALRKVRETNIPFDMGFVGNEVVGAEPADASATPDQQYVVGWSVDAPARTEDYSFSRFIVSGPADAVDEFTHESESEGWILEARASATASLVFAQYRAPWEPGRTTSFMDRYLRESPRRLNIAGVVAKADAQ